MTHKKLFWLVLGGTIILMAGAFIVLKYFVLTPTTEPASIDNIKTSASTSHSPADKEMTFMLGGDMMFDRYIAYKFRDDLKESVANLGEGFFGGRDISLVNLEGPISKTEIVQDTNPENLVFNFPLETVDVLKWLNINSVSLANNHTLNAGSSGFANTEEVLKNAGIAPIGSPNEINETSVKRFSEGDLSISIIAVNALDSQPDLTEIIAQEKQNKSFVIIFPHWGSEYATTHSTTQEKMAHEWIDAGADLVVGSHPHVIQDAAIYNSKAIIYSLGNLLFDQSFSKTTQQGLAISGKISGKKLTLTFLPIQIKNYQPELMQGEEKFNIIQALKKDLGFEACEGCEGWDSFEINL